MNKTIVSIEAFYMLLLLHTHMSSFLDLDEGANWGDLIISIGKRIGAYYAIRTNCRSDAFDAMSLQEMLNTDYSEHDIYPCDVALAALDVCDWDGRYYAAHLLAEIRTMPNSHPDIVSIAASMVGTAVDNRSRMRPVES